MNRRELGDALLDAFDEDSLSELVGDLGFRLGHISTADSLTAIVDNVLEAAQKGGWLTGLVDIALIRNPGNKSLRAAAGNYYKSVSTETVGAAAQAITQLGAEVSEETKQTVQEMYYALNGVPGNGGGVFARLERIENTLKNIQEQQNLYIKGGADVFSARVTKLVLVVMLVMLITLLAIAAWPFLVNLWSTGNV